MLVVFLVLSVASMWLAYRRKLDGRAPLMIFCGAYIVTTVIGSTIISIQRGGELWRLYGGGIDTTLITDYGSFQYLFLLYSPLILCPLTYLLFAKIEFPDTLWRPVTILTSLDADYLSFAITLTMIGGYCVLMMYFHGFLRLSSLINVQGDYVAAIQMREMIFNSMGRIFFGLLYMSLPTLAHFSLYKAVRIASWPWRLLFLLTSFVNCILILLTFQKSLLLLFLLSLAIGLAILGRLKPWMLFGSATGVFLLLNAIQVFVLKDWEALQGLYLIVFRMANAFPFYVNLYPRILPYTGIDFGLDIFGLVPKSNEVETVFSYMYPSINWVQGAAPAPAHLAAYAQFGIWFSVVTMLFIGWYLSFIARLKTRANTSVGYVLFIQGLMGAYYLTQITVRGFLVTSYGLIWVVTPILLLLGTEQFLKYATANVRIGIEAR
jgi:hypothetical protein